MSDTNFQILTPEQIAALSPSDLLAYTARMTEALSAAKSAKAKAIYVKVSEKGALSLYGLGRWPVTLYAGQWETLLANVDTIRKGLNENGDKLSRRDE